MSKGRPRHEHKKDRRQQEGDVSLPRRSCRRKILAEECDTLSLRTTFGVGLELIGYDFVSRWPSLAVRKRLDVNENLDSTAVRRDESKTLLILPVGYSSLITHFNFSQAS